MPRTFCKDVLGADAALVETVAHTQSRPALLPRRRRHLRRRRPGHQDHHPKNGRVKDFKLNTQCSAGNGYFLQSHRAGLRRAGGAVRRHRLRRQGYARASATAARCSCSPTSSTSSARAGSRKRSWPGCATCCRRTSGCTSRRSRTSRRSGTRFVLQGGTQYNLAAVKAQVDFIESRFKGKDASPTSSCTSTAARRAPSARRSKPGACGTTAARPRSSAWTPCGSIEYKTTRNEDTRCYFCKNKCLRTFIDVKTNADRRSSTSRRLKTKVPLEAGAQRADHRHLREGHGGGRRRDARDQGRPRRASRRPTRTSSRSPPRPSSAFPTRRMVADPLPQLRASPRRRSSAPS